MAKEETVKTEELEARYERYKGILKDLTIMSDVFMRNVFKKRECTEYVLQVIMGKKDLRIIDQVLQKDYKNLQGRSAVLDCVARDSDGKQMDVEIQQDNEGASPKRARYHSGLMDMNTLNPGQDFDELPESYVIFITRDDVLGFGLPIYHVNRKIEEVSENFRDEAHIIYVNSKKHRKGLNSCAVKWNRFIVKVLKAVKCKKQKKQRLPLQRWVYLLIRLLKQLKLVLISCRSGLMKA